MRFNGEDFFVSRDARGEQSVLLPGIEVALDFRLPLALGQSHLGPVSPIKPLLHLGLPLLEEALVSFDHCRCNYKASGFYL